MSLNVSQLIPTVIRPALAVLGQQYASEAAVALVVGTGAVESGYHDLHQIGGGPAIGFWQMEPDTYHELWRVTIHTRPHLRDALLSIASRGSGADPPSASEMAWNLRLGAAMCRLRYLWDPHALPAADDVRGLARTWKMAYNTIHGDGTEERFMRAWAKHVAPWL